jgi:hypothetical protein
MSDEVWKQVREEFTFGVKDVWASTLGQIRIGDKRIVANKGIKGKAGMYRSFRLNNHSAYIHRLVFFAHSTLPIETLQNGRVIFKNISDMIDEEGCYRNWYSDLLFEESKINFKNIEKLIKTEEADHLMYGTAKFGVWTDLMLKEKGKLTASKVEGYQICLLNNDEYPCVVKNTKRNLIVKYHFHTGHDGYISLHHNNKNISYKLSHVMLASAFPTQEVNETVDHIDDDSNNHNILNLQWLSSSDNAIKGQIAQPPREKNTQPLLLEGEEWKKLPINDYTREHYEVSNMGRVKKSHSIVVGSRLRGKKYRFTTVALGLGEYKKYYIHQLVCITFIGPIGMDQIVLHDDSIPVNSDGTYRNWASDLRLGSKKDNNMEYHAEKRNQLILG